MEVPPRANRDASSRDGGGAVSGTGGVGGGGTAGDGGVGQQDAAGAGGEAGVVGACQKCEAELCRNQGAYLSMGALAPRCYSSESCRAVLDCVRRTKCAEPPHFSGLECYCGTAAEAACLTRGEGGANGPCMAEIEEAVGESDPASVVPKLYDLSYLSGVAMHLTLCRNYYCSKPCFDYAQNNCAIDLQSEPPVFGNPLCETEACRTEGQCVPRSQCVAWGDCLPDVDGGLPLPDGGPLEVSSPDASSSETALPAAEAGVARDAPSVGPADAAVHTAWSSAQCVACVDTTIQSGEAEGCRPQSGCDKMPADATEEDRQLCRAALSCMQSTGCWFDSPLKCLCGTAEDTACLTAASGACRDQIRAATRAANWSEAGVRFLDTAYPSGYAALLASCYFDDSCKAPCSGLLALNFQTPGEMYLNSTTRSCEPTPARHQCVAKATQFESLDKVIGRGR